MACSHSSILTIRPTKLSLPNLWPKNSSLIAKSAGLPVRSHPSPSKRANSAFLLKLPRIYKKKWSVKWLWCPLVDYFHCQMGVAARNHQFGSSWNQSQVRKETGGKIPSNNPGLHCRCFAVSMAVERGFRPEQTWQSLVPHRNAAWMKSSGLIYVSFVFRSIK